MFRSKTKPEVKEFGDGRLWLRGTAYTRMKRELCALADSRCEAGDCRKYTPFGDGDPDHNQLRQAGGGKHDDRIWIPADPEIIERAFDAGYKMDPKRWLRAFGELFWWNGEKWMKRQLYWKCRTCHDGRHNPKACPVKAPAPPTDEELKRLLGLAPSSATNGAVSEPASKGGTNANTH